MYNHVTVRTQKSMALKVLKCIILFFEFSNVDVDVFPDPIIKIFKFTFVISSLTGELKNYYYRFLSVLEPEVLKKIEAVI